MKGDQVGKVDPDSIRFSHLGDDMHPALSVMLATLVPFVCMALLFWMGHLEETLTEDLGKVKRKAVAPVTPLEPATATVTGEQGPIAAA